jgi:NADH-quinone oxidoreductase subunit N
MFLNKVILEGLQGDLWQDLLGFLPELTLCFAIVLMLLLRLFRAFDDLHLGLVALGLTLVALFFSGWQWYANDGLLQQTVQKLVKDYFGWKWDPVDPISVPVFFTGLLAYDPFTIFLRLFLFSTTALLILLTLLTGIPDREDSADFYCLLLGATIGMSLMASANHLLIVFLGVEMASLPSYALAGFLKGRRQSSEASLKYVVYGGGASGIMLYGISLIAGKYGTGWLPDLARVLPASAAAGFDSVLLLGMLFILIGLGFKLAAVPFHFWCPDVFEGAPAEVAGFLSVASKGAALALLARITLVLATGDYVMGPDYATWLRMAHYLSPAIAFFAALTATFGNLAAYYQTNLKRLLAYSTIAHAGYMMMGLAPLTRDGAGAVLFYLIAYLLMNLGAFAIVAFLRNKTGSEDLSSYRGLVQRSPVLVITLGVFLFSLLGVPPLAGFAAKFQIFSVLFKSGRMYGMDGQTGLSYTMYALLVIGGLNTVISVVYYLKVLKVMILDKSLEEVEGRPPAPLSIPAGSVVYASLLAAMIFVVGILWNPLALASDQGVKRFPNIERVRIAALRAAAGEGAP